MTYSILNMIELMGGSLDISSTVGEGSCFAFTVPVSQASTNAN